MQVVKKPKLQVLIALTLSISTLAIHANSSPAEIHSAPLTSSAVAVPDHYAAETAKLIFGKGGNAVDAAVAIAFTLAVTYPEAGNIGGGGFMTIYHDGKPYFLDYREQAPLKATADMFIDSSGKVYPMVDERSSYTGHRSVAVPGTVAGMWMAHKRFGQLPWKDVIAHAISLAENGFVVDEMLDKLVFNESKARLSSKGNFLEYFSGIKTGQVFKQPDLAKVLKRIATSGPSDFYEGETAQLIAKDMSENGGLIGLKDLRSYKPIWREPIIANWNDFQVITAPPPSSGGIGLVQLLKMKEARKQDFTNLSLNSPQYIHLIAEIEKRVFADRAQYLGDPGFYNVPTEQLISDAYLVKRANEIRTDATSDTMKITAGLNVKFPEKPETTHYSVVDKWGNAVSNTYTLNGFFGSGVVAKGTGILLNDEMDDFSVSPGIPNQMGVIGNDSNAIAPGKRPLSSMSPTILLKDNKVSLVIGTPGGPRIFTSIFQVLTNVYDLKMPLKDAVAAQRFHHQLLPKDTIFWEPFAPISGVLASKLEARGYTLVNQGFNGDVQAIQIQNKTPIPVADPRGRGVSAVIP